MARQPEHALQTAVAVYLAQALPLDAWWTSVDAGQGRMGLLAGVRRRARGVKAGVPDILLLWRGGFRSIELKVGSGRPTECQRAMAADIVAAGGGWVVASSVEEVERVLTGWGIPLRPVLMTPAERDARTLARLTAAPAKNGRPLAEPPSRRSVKRTAAVRSKVMY